LLEKDPNLRPSAKQCLAHEWLQKEISEISKEDFLTNIDFPEDI
jgi:hypothetical protein